jgi:hypothetical protein
MTNQPIQEDPVKRFRKLMGNLSPLTRLPKKSAAGASFLPKQPAMKVTSSLPKEPAVKKVLPSQEKKSQPKTSAPVKTVTPATQSSPAPKPEPVPTSGSSVWGPRLWTTASILSLTINFIMAIVLIVLVISVYRLGLDVNYVMGVGKDLINLPEGLYENFEKMDRASIKTNVKVETSIPVKFDLALNQQTNVVLSQDVTITDAVVTINSEVLDINRANTTIILRQGTVLPVNLSLSVPVDTQVPVVLDVPVNIPLAQTELNEPFVGLQGVIRPLYCFIKPDAVNMDGQPICP